MVCRGLRCRGWTSAQSGAVSDKAQPPCRAKFAQLLLTTAIVAVGFTLASSEAGAVTGCSGTTIIICTSSGNPYATGIPYTSNADDLTLIVQGDVEVSSTAVGIDIDDSDGSVDVNLSPGGSITTYGANAHGIFIDQTGDGIGTDYVSVLAEGNILTNGNSSHGIYVSNTSGDVDILTSGAIMTTGYRSYGIYVNAANNADITASGTIITGQNYSGTPTTNSFAHGIGLRGVTDDINVTLSDGGSITTYGGLAHGIYVDQAGDGTGTDNVSILVEGSITTYGSVASGILVGGTAGDVQISTPGMITTNGASARGIWVRDTTGNVQISAGDILTKGAGSDGIYVTNNTGNLNISLLGNLIAEGNSAEGIHIKDVTGNVDILTSGDITAQRLGISIEDAVGNVDVSAQGNITAQGSGIHIQQTGGDVDVSASGDVITYDVGYSGIYVSDTSGDVSVAASGSITTHAYYARGIHVYGTTGNASVSLSGRITSGKAYSSYSSTDSYAHGILISNTDGYASASLTSGAIIQTYGAQAHGIYVKDTTGNVTVDVAGTITATGSNSDGIRLNNASGTVEVDISGSVSGGSGTGAGLRLESLDSTNTPTVTISGSLGALSDIALVDGDDAVTINNSGTITGTLSLGGGNDVLNNQSGGIWYLRSGDNAAIADFGAGTDSMVNNGTLKLLKGFQLDWQGSLTNLESFTNSGSIDLADGHAGDTLSISGNFVSDGGSLRLDTVLDDGAAPQTDTLQLDTVTTSSGPTQIHIENAGGQGGQTSGNGIQIIDVATSSASDAFALAKRLIRGAYEYTLAQLGQDWYLQSGVFDGTAEYPSIVSGAMLAWKADLGFLHDRLRRLSWNSEEPRIEPVAWTSQGSRKTGTWFNVLAASQNISSDAAYEQKITKLEAGLDGEIETGRSRILLGAFAGMGQHEQDFTDSTSTATTDSALVGAYGKYRWGGFYADGIVKYEHHWADFSGAATEDQQAAFGLDLFGLSLETGYRFAGRHFYLQPHAGMNYVYAKAGFFEDASGATIDLNNGDSLAGELGARVGAALPHAELYLDAGVSHEFFGETQAEVSGFTFSDDLPGTVDVVSAGLITRAVEDKLLLTLATGYAKGPDAEEFTATGNFWVKF